MWTSGDYEGKVNYIPQHIESGPMTLVSKDSIELTYYFDSGEILGVGFIGTADRITQQTFAAEMIDLQITNQYGNEEGFEKIIFTECSFPTMFGTALGCFKTFENSEYTFTLTNNSPFDLEIPGIQFGILDGELVTEFDPTMDEGDLLPIFAYQIMIIASSIMIISGFVLRFYRK